MEAFPALEQARLNLDAGGTPFSDIYGDVYHSAAGAHLQSQHVFLSGNGLPLRWQYRPCFLILETGFGLGLNFLATWLAWRNDPLACRRLQFFSVEKHPFNADDLARAHARWPEFSALSAELLDKWPPLVAGKHRIELEQGRLSLFLCFGDARVVIPELAIAADAFFLDGFSPAKNPDLWSSDLCRSLARCAAPEATVATWSVAGSVRRALFSAGFVVEKRPGFANKRQMLTGHYRDSS